MRILGRLVIPVWLVVIGAIVMYAVFVTVASVQPAQVAGVTIAIVGLRRLNEALRRNNPATSATGAHGRICALERSAR